MQRVKTDINAALARVDRSTSRFCSRLSRKLVTAACFGSDGSAWDELSANVEKFILSAMLLAHDAYVPVRHHVAMARVSYESALDKQQREAARGFYSSIAKAATGRTMSAVRQRMLGSIVDLAEGRSGRAQRMQVRGIIKKSAPVALVSTLERTTTSMAFNASVWAQDSQSEDVWGFTYTTAGDERVRDAHAEMEDVTYPKEHSFWKKYAPPNGWNCRCTLTPVFEWESPSVVPFRGTPNVDPEFLWNAGEVVTGRKRVA